MSGMSGSGGTASEPLAKLAPKVQQEELDDDKAIQCIQIHIFSAEWNEYVQ